VQFIVWIELSRISFRPQQLASSGTETLQLSQQRRLLRHYSMPSDSGFGRFLRAPTIPFLADDSASDDLPWLREPSQAHPLEKPFVRRRHLPSDFGQQALLNNL